MACGSDLNSEMLIIPKSALGVPRTNPRSIIYFDALRARSVGLPQYVGYALAYELGYRLPLILNVAALSQIGY